MRVIPTRLTSLELKKPLVVVNAPYITALASAITYTAEQIATGFIIRDTASANRADLFPTAPQLYDEFGAPGIGASFIVTIRNAGANTITMTTNTGLTLSGTMTIATLNSKSFVISFTGPTTATIYSLGTVVF